MERTNRPAAVRASLWALLLGFLVCQVPGAASALTLADTQPLAFQASGAGLGLVSNGHAAGWDLASAGITPSWSFDASDPQLSAGNSAAFPWVDLGITQDLGPIHQNPQDALNPAPEVASHANPFIADSTWTVTNLTGADVEGAVLAFVIPHYAAYPNAVDVALDGNAVELIEYTTGGGDTLFLAAVHLGDLAAAGGGASATFTVRYIISGELVEVVDGSHTTYQMPPLMVTAFSGAEAPVPEPGAALVFGLGLLIVGRHCRRR